MTPQKPALQETGKQRAARIPLDYYKRPNVLERWKVRLAGVALLATLAWLGASWAITRNDDFQSSRGPLASVHQNWDNQCQACHEPFTSISSHSATPSSAIRWRVRRNARPATPEPSIMRVRPPTVVCRLPSRSSRTGGVFGQLAG